MNVLAHVLVHVCAHPARTLRRLTVTTHARLVAPERGQATVEYALVMIGVAAVAGLLVSWVRGTDLIEKLFDKVVRRITP